MRMTIDHVPNRDVPFIHLQKLIPKQRTTLHLYYNSIQKKRNFNYSFSYGYIYLLGKRLKSAG